MAFKTRYTHYYYYEMCNLDLWLCFLCKVCVKYNIKIHFCIEWRTYVFHDSWRTNLIYEIIVKLEPQLSNYWLVTIFFSNCVVLNLSLYYDVCNLIIKKYLELWAYCSCKVVFDITYDNKIHFNIHWRANLFTKWYI